jgi:hypothetical protein
VCGIGAARNQTEGLACASFAVTESFAVDADTFLIIGPQQEISNTRPSRSAAFAAHSNLKEANYGKESKEA